MASTIIPSFVKLAQRHESAWSRSWQFFTQQLKELRISWRNWALGLNNSHTSDPLRLVASNVTISTSLGTTINSTQDSPIRFAQHIPTRPSTYWNSPKRNERVAPVHSQPTLRNRLLRSRKLSGPTTLKGFTGTTGRGGINNLLPGGYSSPALRNALRRAKSEVAARDIASSTRTKYAGSYKFWVEFCRACGASPLLTRKHPHDDAELITDYVMFENAGHGNKHGTIKQKLAAIRYFNIDLGYGNPREDCPSLDRIMKGIRRECGAVNRNLPVTSEMLTHIVDRAGLSHLRTRAVVTSIVTAFMFLLRCSEYASEDDATMGKHVIKRYHVVFKRKGIVTANPLIADQVEMAIPSSKTDQLGQGHTRTHYRTEGALCPVRLLAEWVNSTSEMPSGVPLFSFINPDPTGHDTQNVTRARVTKVLKAAATDLGYPASAVLS